VSYTYPGAELELFAAALRWKRYWASHVRPFLRGRVLEVGAGLGSNTRLLRDSAHARWVCLEPDPVLAVRLEDSVRRHPAGRCEVVVGTLRDLPSAERFDALLYADVLEHIEDDAGELAAARDRLAPGGSLVVLSPAHDWLFSPFDAAIGHHRRYNRRRLEALTPARTTLHLVRYLDCAGLVATLGNRLLLRKRMPGRGDIRAWDGLFVPISRVLDPVLGYRLGKSLLAVWRVG
jgi:SAM-dependent methyltransferase